MHALVSYECAALDEWGVILGDMLRVFFCGQQSSLLGDAVWKHQLAFTLPTSEDLCF
jgi:hypothetical protein